MDWYSVAVGNGLGTAHAGDASAIPTASSAECHTIVTRYNLCNMASVPGLLQYNYNPVTL